MAEQLDRLTELLENIGKGKEIVLETIRHNGTRIPLKTIFFRDGTWQIRKVISFTGDNIVSKEIEIFHDEAMTELRAYLGRERGKRKKKR